MTAVIATNTSCVPVSFPSSGEQYPVCPFGPTLQNRSLHRDLAGERLDGKGGRVPAGPTLKRDADRRRARGVGRARDGKGLSDGVKAHLEW